MFRWLLSSPAGSKNIQKSTSPWYPIIAILGNDHRRVAASSFRSLNDLLHVEDRQDDTGSRAVESHGSPMGSCFY